MNKTEFNKSIDRAYEAITKNPTSYALINKMLKELYVKAYEAGRKDK